MSYEHNHAHNAKLVSRMAKIVGHANSIKTMIENDRDCSEILIQIAAVKSALNSVGKLLLTEHIDLCVAEALKSGKEDTQKVIEEMTDAIDKFVR